MVNLVDQLHIVSGLGIIVCELHFKSPQEFEVSHEAFSCMIGKIESHGGQLSRKSDPSDKMTIRL